MHFSDSLVFWYLMQAGFKDKVAGNIVLEKSDRISQGLAKLISFAKKSAGRGSPQHNLNTYQILSGAIENLSRLDTVKGDQIASCVTLLGHMIELQQRVIKADEISRREIPQIHPVAQILNKILINSARTAVKSGDNEYITEQCEALLAAADAIRSDSSLRTSGILDAGLKDIIGRLREKADIVNLFEGTENKAFTAIMEKAEIVLEGGNLEEIGKAYARLCTIGVKVKNQYVLRANFTNYLMGYKKSFIDRIEDRMNEFKKNVSDSDFFECRELLAEMEGLEKLEKYHREPNVSKRIQFFRNKVLEGKQVPIETLLDESIRFVIASGSDFFSTDYERLYDEMHCENEIFTAAFYERTLKGLPPRAAIDLLKDKRKKMDQVDIGKAGQFAFETALKKRMDELIEVFESSIRACLGK